MVASNDLDFLCLTETHIRRFDSDSFLRILFFLTGLVAQILVVVLVFSLDPPTDPIKLNLPSTSHLRIWWCQSGFMAIHCCLPASTTLQDHVPVTFWKNSCHLLVSCHLLTLHTISVVILTFMLMFQLVMDINL